MHHFSNTNYRVDRTDLNTQRTTNTFRLYDESLLRGMRWTAFGVERDRGLIEQCSQALDRNLTAGGAAVDGGF